MYHMRIVPLPCLDNWSVFLHRVNFANSVKLLLRQWSLQKAAANTVGFPRPSHILRTYMCHYSITCSDLLISITKTLYAICWYIVLYLSFACFLLYFCFSINFCNQRLQFIKSNCFRFIFCFDCLYSCNKTCGICNLQWSSTYVPTYYLMVASYVCIYILIITFLIRTT